MTDYNSITLPLHSGHPPHYLIRRMVKLSNAISKVLIKEYGTQEFLKRLSDPLWFQAFGNVLGFDWHSSGVTTVVMGVLKQALSVDDHGIIVAGGKGPKAKETPNEIVKKSDEQFNLSNQKIKSLIKASRMSSKVDNSAVQDNYSLYHHNIIFDHQGNWAVVQQGLNDQNNTARRYHWFSKNIGKAFSNEPHSGIIGDVKLQQVLNMTSKKSIDSQKITLDLVNDRTNYENLSLSVNRMLQKRKENPLDIWLGESGANISDDTKKNFSKLQQVQISNCNINSNHHYSMPKKIDWSLLKKVYDIQPSTYDEFLSITGVGPSTVRALSLIGELIFGKAASWEDPVKFSFAHGGKDGVPYYVDRKSYDESIRFLDSAIEGAILSREEKINALKKLNTFNSKMYLKTGD